MIDVLLVLGFVGYSIAAGLWARRRASLNLDEYFLAGRSVPGWQAGVSMAATQFAADTPLLVAGLVATGGVFLLWRLWIYGVAFLLMGFVLAASWRRAGVLTDAELTEIRYSGRGVLALRVLKALYYGTLVNGVVLAMVLVAATRIAEVFLPWHGWLPELHAFVEQIVMATGLSFGEPVTDVSASTATADNLISVLAIVGFTATYSTTGGLRGVVATDVAQFGLGMLGTAIYAGVVWSMVGGGSGLVERLVALYGEVQATRVLSLVPPADELASGFLVLIGLQWLFQMNSDGTGYLAQRSMACRTDRDARVAAVVFTGLQIVLRSLFWLVIAVGLLVLYPLEGGATAAEREMTFVIGVDEHLPAGARGLMLVGLLAALASTVDTHLNWGASYWTNDLYDRLLCRQWLRRTPRDTELVWVARLSNVLLVGIALAILANLGSIRQAWQISLVFGAGMGSVLLLRWLWERINLYSELAAMATSLLVAPGLVLSGWSDVAQLGTMAGVSTVAAVGVTWLTPPTEPAVLEAFYRRVRPIGWWGRTAARLDEHRSVPLRRLLRQLRLVGFASLSTFAMLAGLATVLLPPPGISPWWGLAGCGLALAAVPGWWPGIGAGEPTQDAEDHRTRDPSPPAEGRPTEW